ncbi:hypothetical protein GCM10011521_11350 [Arenimonas soli]|uniref:Uncharacterized protein n=1 Tax=Arenimonas soli TaxID=2269504 RepID=A0ABQ1HGF3_9GAMM|nr:hypothetical protein GCM10011521_11350 [Arenimonas soli]
MNPMLRNLDRVTAVTLLRIKGKLELMLAEARIEQVRASTVPKRTSVLSSNASRITPSPDAPERWCPGLLRIVCRTRSVQTPSESSGSELPARGAIPCIA